MADALDLDAMLERFRDRAAAVKNRNLPQRILKSPSPGRAPSKPGIDSAKPGIEVASTRTGTRFLGGPVTFARIKWLFIVVIKTYPGRAAMRTL